MERFVSCFAELDDPREDNVRHDLHEILIIAFCAMLCGAEDCSDMALFGRAKREPSCGNSCICATAFPSHDTFSRVFRLLDPMQFQACFLRFMEDFAEAAQGVIAIDGKTLRRSFDRASGKSPLHLVSAWAAGSRPGSRPGGDGGEVERDHRRAETAGDDLAQGRDRHHRRAQLPARHRRAGDRQGRRLRAGAEGQSGHVA